MYLSGIGVVEQGRIGGVNHGCAPATVNTIGAASDANANVTSQSQTDTGDAAGVRNLKSKKAASPQSDASKLLLMHGYVQNAEVFSSRTSNLRSKALKVAGQGKLEFTFAESPLKVHASLASEDSNLDGRGWYNPREAIDGNSSVRPVDSSSYVGWEEPLDNLRSLTREQGPFMGLLAFSQGGVLAAVLLSEMRSQMRFGIFVSCFCPLDPAVRALIQADEHEPIDVPTLHVIGNADPFVKEERSIQLAKLFKNPVVVTHDGGHIMIPKELFGDVKDFLARASR